MKIRSVTILGSGIVAQTLARGFQRHGATVTLGTREPQRLATFTQETGVRAVSPAVAIEGAELVVLAVKGVAAEAVVRSHAAALTGKVVIDATNPISEQPPQHGVLVYFTGANESLMERLQLAAPAARFVKAFNSVGNAFMVNPSFPGGRPTMFIAGNDPTAKALVTEVLVAFGWEAEDVGLVESARPIEALCQLWCAPGLLRNQWQHAFKLLKP